MPEVSLERGERRRPAAESEMAVGPHQTEARLFGAEALVERSRRAAQELDVVLPGRGIPGHDVRLDVRPVTLRRRARQGEPIVERGRIRFAEQVRSGTSPQIGL